MVSPIQSAAVATAPIDLLTQVKNYMQNEGTRAAILGFILDQIPDSGDVVLIGHSLGSVISIDLIDHLPPSLHVRRFITIGSPAGSRVLQHNSRDILKKFPYARVDDWSNFLDPLDGVTAGRTLTALFPGAQDFQISGARGHSAELYLKHPAVATLIDDVLNPDALSEPATRDGGIVRRLSDAEASSLLSLFYANHVIGHIDDKEARNRYKGALDVLQDAFIQEEVLNTSDAQSLPHELALLAAGRVPQLPRRWSQAEAVRQAVVLAFTNVLAPYEVDVADARFDALPGLFVELGMGAPVGALVADAAKEVNSLLNNARNLFGTRARLAAAAAGVALLAAGPIGIAAAGAAGAVGAAALTSGLAAFGPGGMIGGLAMLGGLASTGAMVTTIAATAGGGTQPLVVDPTSVAIQVAIAYALNSLDEPFDTDLWHRLTSAEAEITAELNRLTPFSDEKSPSIERLRVAHSALEKMIEFVREKKLTPQSLMPALTT